MLSFNKFMSKLGPDLSSFCLSRPSFHQIWFLFPRIFLAAFERVQFSPGVAAPYDQLPVNMGCSWISCLIPTKHELKELTAHDFCFCNIFVLLYAEQQLIYTGNLLYEHWQYGVRTMLRVTSPLYMKCSGLGLVFLLWTPELLSEA